MQSSERDQGLWPLALFKLFVIIVDTLQDHDVNCVAGMRLSVNSPIDVCIVTNRQPTMPSCAETTVIQEHVHRIGLKNCSVKTTLIQAALC